MTDFKTFKKLETMPASGLAFSVEGAERLVVLVKLRQGAAAPTYVVPRARISANLFSAEIPAKDLERMDRDPAIESVAVSQRLPLIR